ncbi:hypothetical protein SAXI111661_15425 [Saccharomonospora xinjiangensis]|uniref:hypothetical protein n=1 Tax=Saccharomonospora xinjiangensis TaxID=75294 RepID=UPI00106FBEB8|nr:hypothetical protein [Saccharomonospora xinjiangensis]QBQ61285.1 hypothetical protein EYD13_14685 [Saccharomonospora xinjiangensis]
MEFRKSRTLTWFSLGLIVVGAVGTVLFVGWLLGEGGRRTSLILILAPFVLIFGLLGLVATLVPLKLRIDEYGLRVRNRRERVSLPDPVPWQVFDAVTIEPKPGEQDKDPYLIVWPKGPVPGLPAERAITRDGAVGFPVVSLGDLTEPPEALAKALRHYAGPLFRETPARHGTG